MDTTLKNFSSQIITAKSQIKERVLKLHTLIDNRAEELFEILDQYELAYHRDCSQIQHDIDKLEKLRDETCTLKMLDISGTLKSSVDRAMTELTLSLKTKQVKVVFLPCLDEAVGTLANVEIEDISPNSSPNRRKTKNRSISSVDSSSGSEKSLNLENEHSPIISKESYSTDLDESQEYSKIARDAAAENNTLTCSRRRVVEERKELDKKRSNTTGDKKEKYNSMKLTSKRQASYTLASVPLRAQASYKDMTVLSHGVEKGEKIGQVSDGHGIVVDFNSQKLYVCDCKNNRVQVFFDSLQPSSVFGDSKHSPAKMNGPWGIDIDRSRIYVTQNQGHCVKVYSSERKYIDQFGRKGVEFGEFMYPEGISIDSNQSAYVCDSGNCRIQVFSIDGKKYKFSFSFGGSFLSWPHDVHAKGNNVFILDSMSPCILECSKEGALLNKLLTNGPGKDVNCPRFLTVDMDGNILISDYENSVISVFTNSGLRYTYIGGAGYGSGCLSHPMGIALMPTGGIVCVDGKEFPVLQIFD